MMDAMFAHAAITEQPEPATLPSIDMVLGRFVI